ncbi:hypothetical protein G205_22892 [Arthrobacter nitrophenolicus]|uniref:Uncharacterized protein n=1 Tax=Arthrobacter nitrophenolicus TaxID=683150 RepID=L8TLB7_9MICC|nr:hypothetical protein G205_22892 [Arthrobacter nitrophenolicus]
MLPWGARPGRDGTGASPRLAACMSFASLSAQFKATLRAVDECKRLQIWLATVFLQLLAPAWM